MDSNNNKQTVDFNLSLIADFFTRIDRQGPGSDELTRQALGFVEGAAQMSQIADIGCGTGRQTAVLARETSARITAVDLLPEMLEGLSERASREGFADRLTTVEASMCDLPFADGQFDMIWAEGSIYGVGFEKGLREWRRFLKPGGWIAVSEECWFTPERPFEIEDYWVSAYPDIDTVAANTAKMWGAGYLPVAQFIVPDRCWTENFYDTMGPVFEPFLRDNGNSRAARDLVASMHHEIDLYYRYRRYCGYVFFIGRKME